MSANVCAWVDTFSTCRTHRERWSDQCHLFNTTLGHSTDHAELDLWRTFSPLCVQADASADVVVVGIALACTCYDGGWREHHRHRHNNGANHMRWFDLPRSNQSQAGSGTLCALHHSRCVGGSVRHAVQIQPQMCWNQPPGWCNNAPTPTADSVAFYQGSYNRQ
jgi:hypothetical protein